MLFSPQSEMSEGRQGRGSSTGDEEESLAILRRWVGCFPAPPRGSGPGGTSVTPQVSASGAELADPPASTPEPPGRSNAGVVWHMHVRLVHVRKWNTRVHLACPHLKSREI